MYRNLPLRQRCWDIKAFSKESQCCQKQQGLWQINHTAANTTSLQWEEKGAAEGVVVIYIIIERIAWWENQVNFISCYQLQDNRVSQKLKTPFFLILIIRHNPLVVLVDIHTHIALFMTTYSELEIADPTDWCCEETYRVRVENEKQWQYVDLHDHTCSCDLQYVTCSWTVSFANVDEDPAVLQYDRCVVWSNIFCSQGCVKGHLYISLQTENKWSKQTCHCAEEK